MKLMASPQLIVSSILIVQSIILCCYVKETMCRQIFRDAMMQQHEQWMARHGRVYRDAEERRKRFDVFKQNAEYIESFNNANSAKEYKLSVNRFADITHEEFRSLRKGAGMRNYSKNEVMSAGGEPFKYENVAEVPPSVDWRERGAVTPVKNQGECSSCWAFSAVAATEGLLKLTTGRLISLSEQQLIDCDTGGFNQGCKYGLMDPAFNFIHSNHGLTSEQEYPYKGTEQTCRMDSITASTLVEIRGFEDVPRNDEKALLKAIANQPVSAAIDSSASDFKFYSSGIYTGDCGTNYDHAITIVGYGTSEKGTDYWLVKNSWGQEWGESGYMRIQRGFEAKEGKCGIAMIASYPIP